MNIGDPVKEWYIVPIEMPEPLREPVEPEKEPVLEPEKVEE